MEYTYIIEKTGNGYSAYVPDLPGCITTGPTLERTKTLIGEAVVLYIDSVAEFGGDLPEPMEITEEMERERYYTGVLAVDRAVPA